MKWAHAMPLAALLAAVSCTPKDAGQLTLVNSGVEPLRISVDARTFTLRPSNHITKDLSAGPHGVKVDGGEVTDVAVRKGLTTVFDSTGLSCYVTVDFSGRRRGGEPKIAERFRELQVFTTAKPMITVLGNILPKDLPEKDALRLHQVDCEIINDDASLVGEVGNLP